MHVVIAGCVILQSDGRNNNNNNNNNYSIVPAHPGNSNTTRRLTSYGELLKVKG